MKYLYLAFLLLNAALVFAKPPRQGRSHLHGRRVDRVPSYSAPDQLPKEAPEYPTCPDAEVIYPCYCFTVDYNMFLDCSAAQYDAQLTEVFQKEFPDKEFFQFIIEGTINLYHLNFSTNGVTFKQFLIYDYNTIESITEDVFRDSADTVEGIVVANSQISDGGFPFEAVSGYPNLVALEVYENQLTEMPIIQSDTISDLVFFSNQISSLDTGIVDGVPGLYQFLLERNQLRALEAGTLAYWSTPCMFDFDDNLIDTLEVGAFYDGTSDGTGEIRSLQFTRNQLTTLAANSVPVTSATDYISFATNQISTIEANVFDVRGEPELNSVELSLYENELTTLDEGAFGPVMPYVYLLLLQGNPLECGCDIAWLVTSSYLDKLSDSTTCANGVPVKQLDPALFADC